jgi:putative ABC transport system permease protein
VLDRTIAATPYRHGFTAGAMMGGLALMVSIWTNGGAILRDWLDKIEFPDAFVSGLNLREECQTALDEMPFIENTCAVTLHPVDTDAFGVRALQKYRTSFLAFEPDRFFEMTKLQWVQGDPETAKRKLMEGGAIIVSREFLVAQGLGIGDTFVCSDTATGEEHSFEIAGVVSSPGLEVVSKFFNIGREYHQQALHAVFGSRKDLIERFGTRAINLIQIDLADTGPNAIDDERAVELIRERMFELNAGVADAGSGRWVKREIRLFATGRLFVFSGVAVMAMLVACFGVANLVIASIESRRFEFGVLRSVGGSRGLLTRLVVAEAVIVALTAALLGTLLGLQGSLAGQRLYALLLGITLHFRPPGLAIAAGWLVVLVLTLGAAWPAIWRLSRIRPRELLATMKG